MVYVRNLKAAGRFFCLHPQEAFILANCASNGELVRDYCLLQPVHFHDQTSEIKLLTCSCPSSLDQSARLHATSSVITENLQQFKDREVSLYCIHRRAFQYLHFSSDVGSREHGEEEDEALQNSQVSADILTLQPLLAAVFNGSSYGLIGRKRTPKLQCLLCSGHCNHVRAFEEWCEEQDIELESAPESDASPTYHCYSYKKVPYPLPGYLRELHDLYESGKKDINWQESFVCPLCGPTPKVVVCDGTMISFRKDLLEQFQVESGRAAEEEKAYISGSQHAERVLIRSQKARELLLQFSGYSRDRKRLRNPSQLTSADLQQLDRLLRAEDLSSFAEVIQRLVHENGRSSPEPYRLFLSELSRSSPICGLLQVAGHKKVLQIITAVADGQIDLRNSVHHTELGEIQQHAPVLAQFINTCPTEDGVLPEDVRKLLHLLLRILTAPFQGSPPLTSVYPTPTEHPLSFFPSLPKLHGDAAYEADRVASRSEQDSCRKNSYGHPTLSPGIFTIYLPAWGMLWL